MSNFYCIKCGKRTTFYTKNNLIKEYKGVVVNVKEKIAICNDCGEPMFVPKIDETNLKRLYRKYKRIRKRMIKEGF